MRYKNVMMGYYSTLIVMLAVIVMASSSCVNLPKIDDPVLTGLYVIKQEWLSIREYVINRNIEGTLSDKELAKFKEKDDAFKSLYDVTIMVYLSDTSGVDVDSNIRDLRDILLSARQKYYKED